jgi:hypothetical protein
MTWVVESPLHALCGRHKLGTIAACANPKHMT